jgi:hypothetical protein
MGLWHAISNAENSTLAERDNMKTTHTLAALVLLLAGADIAKPYDFFDLSRYPEGGKRREWVELYTVKEPGGEGLTR